MMKPRVLFYSQHVLGLGHLVRSLEIIRSLRDFEVCFLNGGEPVPELDAVQPGSTLDRPRHIPPTSKVHTIQLPVISASSDFRELNAPQAGEELQSVKQRRCDQILKSYEWFTPDIVMIELFPFGRKQFSFELVPLLARIRNEDRDVKVVCSLRDILVKKSDGVAHEERVCQLLNRYFHQVLIHSDPAFQSLDETFSLTQKIRCDVQYTGYVVQHPAASAPEGSAGGSDGVPTIVASIGGGRVGGELLDSVIRASQLLNATFPHRVLVFTGPYLSQDEYEALQKLGTSSPNVKVSRFTPDLVGLMKRSSLSVSMAGYNTCMNILTSQVPALVLPFTGGGNDEQSTRADKLQALGLLKVLHPEDLVPAQLAQMMHDAMGSPRGEMTLDVSGTTRTPQLLAQLLASGEAKTLNGTPQSKGRKLSAASGCEGPGTLSRLLLETVEQAGQVQIFLRDDDAAVDDAQTRRLLDICLSRRVPLSLAVIPDRLTVDGISMMKLAQKCRPDLFEFHQHGWCHANHEPTLRKCEFGLSRGLALQLADIARGKRVMQDTFGDLFFPAFTPPWNRCTHDTFVALDELEFQVLSRDLGASQTMPAVGNRFQEIPITLDLHDWHQGGVLRPTADVIAELCQQLTTRDRIGIMLHHEVMDEAAFALLDNLLSELTRYQHITFSTLANLAAKSLSEATT